MLKRALSVVRHRLHNGGEKGKKRKKKKRKKRGRKKKRFLCLEGEQWQNIAFLCSGRRCARRPGLITFSQLSIRRATRGTLIQFHVESFMPVLFTPFRQIVFDQICENRILRNFEIRLRFNSFIFTITGRYRDISILKWSGSIEVLSSFEIDIENL